MNYDTPISKHWQLAQGGHSITQGVDDIDLCIHTILSTPKGADVLRPHFGSDHFDYLDTPEDVFIPNVVREVVLAIQTWEKRAVVKDVKFEGNVPHITMKIFWSVADDIASDLYQTQIYIGTNA